MSKSVFSVTDTYHDSSYCFYAPDAVHHVEVERFSRIKLERMSPIIAMLEIEGEAGLLRLNSCSAFAIVEGDFLTPWIRSLIELKASGAPIILDELTESFIDTCDRAKGPIDQFDRNITHEVRSSDYRVAITAFLAWLIRPRTAIYICGHHLCHATNSFFSSPHKKALTITLDGGGYDFIDGNSNMPRSETYGGVFSCSGKDVVPLDWMTTTSLGACWARVTTQVLGMNFGEEGTLMAMAAFGNPQKFANLLAQNHPWSSAATLQTEEGKVCFETWLSEIRSLISCEQDQFDLAASLQAETESRVKKHLDQWVTPSVNALCLSGGFFLNCQVTGKIRDWYPWLKDVFVPPAPYDGGLSIGAAQYVLHQLQRQTRKLGIATRFPFGSGRSYSRFEILTACRSAKVPLLEVTPEEIVARLEAGQIGGIFSGRAESGRRALGNRSIVADPRSAAAKDRLNNVIKKRKPFRPFAPFVLADEASNWFECELGTESPYMSHAFPIREEKRAQIPAICHADGTARIQTVHEDLSPGLHALLLTWFQASGVPILLNTSFNDNEPIVQSPENALNCFARTPLDFLYFADEGLLCERGAK
jgi:carbamoyltransferase